MFASVKIVSPSPVKAVSVPEQAVIHSGTRDIVIVALGSGRFSPREVKLGPRGSGYVQVLEGIAEGQSIVTSSQFLIDAESNLKAAIAQMTRDR
jgi:Cu(I)/Ag(I) efflux system membrane fusion protein